MEFRLQISATASTCPRPLKLSWLPLVKSVKEIHQRVFPLVALLSLTRLLFEDKEIPSKRLKNSEDTAGSVAPTTEEGMLVSQSKLIILFLFHVITVS
jgi:hypothetical protein